jgi:hypothetical protein
LRVQGIHGGIVYEGSFEFNMYVMEQEEAEFESANPASAAKKLTKYGKEH